MEIGAQWVGARSEVVLSTAQLILPGPGCREFFRDRREYIPVACGKNIRVFDAPEKIPVIRDLSSGSSTLRGSGRSPTEATVSWARWPRSEACSALRFVNLQLLHTFA